MPQRKFLDSVLPPALLLNPLLLESVDDGEPVHLQVQFKQALFELVPCGLRYLENIGLFLCSGHLFTLYKNSF